MARWTAANLRELREAAAVQGRSLDELAAEIRRLCDCSPLASYRMAHGWSQPAVTEKFRDVAARVLDQPTLSRLEQWPGPGGRQPTATQLISLAAVYSTTAIKLVAPDCLELLSPHDRNLLQQYSALTAPGPPAARTNAEQIDPSRQTIPGPDQAATSAAVRAMRFAAEHETRGVGPEGMAALRAEVHRMAADFLKRPPAALVPDLVELQSVGFRLLDERRQRPADSKELYLLTGAVSVILAGATWNLGDVSSAMTQARAAYVCADNADHDELRAWARGWQSSVAYWSGSPHQAAQFAAAGAVYAKRGSAAVWLPTLIARAEAMLGNSEAAEAALKAAERASDANLQGELDEFGGMLTLAPAWQKYLAADAMIWLPDGAAAAAETAAQAIADAESATDGERFYAMEAGAKALLGLARVQLGDIEAARDALDPVLRLAPALRVGGVVGTARRTRAALRSHQFTRSQQARALSRDLEDFCHQGPPSTSERAPNRARTRQASGQ
ncbi:MAG TPA: hypothetical protein VF163_02625 [Micromonosporaceae bacterium]